MDQKITLQIQEGPNKQVQQFQYKYSELLCDQISRIPKLYDLGVFFCKILQYKD